MILSLSGGLDSTVLLAMHMKLGDKVEAYTFKYPSKHNELERAAAYRVGSQYGLVVQTIDLTTVFNKINSDLLQSGGPIPEGHYEAESMRATVVPGRNNIFIAVLAGIAESRGHSQLSLGIHAGDHAIYPDCRPEFYESVKKTVHSSTQGKVDVLAPFLNFTKDKIVQIGLNCGAPFHLTRTCYTTKEKACGRCGSCSERLMAFAANGVDDPIDYETREIMPKEKVDAMP